MRRALVAGMCVLSLLLVIPSSPVQSADVQITADAAILMDATTGEILYAKNADRKMHPASTTKIMTAILALEHGHLEDVITVSRRAALVEGSSMHLHQGQRLTLEELLCGLLLRSGNDAAVAIAEYIGGSVEHFVALMNKKALNLGAVNTHFLNPHGLSRPDHYSTARDLAIMARYALQNPKFAEIVSTKQTAIEWEGREKEYLLQNTNKLLWLFEGADGVKTGTTGAAGHCLVSSATRGPQRLIAVVLHSSARWRDSVKLLQYGFTNYNLLIFANKETVVAVRPVVNGMQRYLDILPTGTVAIVAPEGDQALVSTVVNLPPVINAPVHKGTKLGEMIIYIRNQPVRSFDLIAAQDILKKTPSRVFLNQLLRLFARLFNWGLL